MEYLRDDHERGCLHLAGERACRLPCLPLGGQLVRDWHLRGTDLAVKAVLGLDNARVIREAERLRRLMQRGNNRKIRDCRELDGEVLTARALLPDGAGGNDDIAALYLVHNAAGRAHTDERVRAALDQLLHGNGRRRAADAGRADRNRNTVQRACPQRVLAVVGDLLRVIEILRDLLAPRRVTGQNDVPPDIALGDLNVHLSAVYQHTISPSRSTVLMFFSALLRGSMTSWPQPRHFSLKSIPIRSTCHCLLPHGCCFFMVRMSFTCISIGFTSFAGGSTAQLNCGALRKFCALTSLRLFAIHKVLLQIRASSERKICSQIALVQLCGVAPIIHIIHNVYVRLFRFALKGTRSARQCLVWNR